MPSPKQGVSFRLSDEARNLIRELSLSLGISQAAVVELAVRRLAKVDELTSDVIQSYRI